MIRKFTVGALLCAATTAAMAQKQWTATGSSLNWSDGGNWSDSQTPIAGDVLYFEDLLIPNSATNFARAINNVVDANTAVGALNFTSRSFSTTNRFHTTLLPDSVTLTLGGLGSTAAALAIGDVPGTAGFLSSGNWTNYSSLVGPGTLAVTDANSIISVGWRNRATLDLSGLSNFTASVSQLRIGASIDNPNTTGPTGWLLLAKTNVITTTPNLTAPGILLGHATNTTGSGVVGLGAVNTINTDGLVVGGRRSTSTSLVFGPTYSNAVVTSTLALRGSAGGTTPIPVFAIGDLSAAPDAYATTTNSTSVGATATADFTGGTVDILADSIFIGRSTRPEIPVTSGTGTGTLIVEQGTVTATNVYMAYKQPGTTNASIGSGTLVLKSNAVLNVVKDLVLTFRTNGTAFISQPLLIVSNTATLNIGGNLSTIHSIGSWTPAAIALGGGTINLASGGSVSVPTLQGFGILTNASAITVTNALSANTDTTIGTLNLSSNLAVGSAVKLTFNLGTNNTVGGGVNDYINVANNINFTNNPVITTFSAPLVAGTYSLITYGGTQTGSVFWTNTTRSPIGLAQGGGQVALVVTNYTPATLTWRASGGSANWDTTNVVWNANTEKFYALDNVLFDDTAVATNIVVVGTVNPSSLTINNSSKLLTLSSGVLGGYSDFTKNGAGKVVLTMTGNNTFTGPVNLNAGTVVLGAFNTGMLGDANGVTPINIASGATLEMFNGVGSTSSFGRPVNVVGTGVGGIGAIVCTAANAPTFATRNFTLLGNTTIGCTNTAANPALAGFAAPYNFALDLAGYTLTTTGPGPFRLNQYAITNSGSIVVGGSYLGLNSCIVDGPGVIDLGSKVLNFYNGFTTGYVAKAISVVNGAISAPTANAATIPLQSPIAIANGGSLSVTNSQTILASGIISGNGSLNKYGNSNLVLAAANTYSGATLVAAGKLALSSTGTLASPSITVNSSGTFDVTAKPAGYTPPSGQTINVDSVALGNFTAAAGGSLRGSGVITGSVTVATGGILAEGSPVVNGTLTIATNLTFNGGTNVFKLGGPNDLVVVGGDLTFTAPTTIRIDPVGPLTTHLLYQYSGALTGADTNNIKFVSSRPLAYVLDTNTPGQVSVTISGGVTLDWQGGAIGAPTAWDANLTTNWLNSGNPEVFLPGDAVVFGDSALTNVVNLPSSVQPAAITLNNSALPYTFTGPGGITAGNLIANGGGSVTLSNNGNVTLTGAGLGLNAGTVTFSPATNITLTAKLSGGAGLTKAGTSTLTVASADSTNFTGITTVNAGTIRAASPNALGASSIKLDPGASFDVNGQIAVLANFTVAGVGADGLGALNNRGAQQTNALNNITLSGDTTLGAASNRWDIAPLDSTGPTPGTFVGANYKLTKAGTNDLWIRPLTDTGLGDITITAGRLIFAGAGTQLGASSSNLVVRTNAALGLANGLQSDGKKTLIEAGGSLYSSGGTNQYGGPIVLSNGLIRLESLAQLTLSGNLSGPANLNIQGVNAGNFGTVTLSGTNTYTGGTLVNDGELDFATSGSIPANTNIVLNSRVAFNLSGHPIIGLLSNVVSPASVRLDMQTVGTAGAAQASLTGDGATWSGPIRITGSIAQCAANFSSGLGGLIVAGAVDGTGFLGNSSGNGGVKINGNNVLVSDVSLGGTGVRFNNSLQFTGTLSCVNSGLGGSPGMTKLVLGAGGNFWTNTFWQRGIIQLGADNALPLAPITIGTLAAGADHRVVLDLNGHNQGLASWNETFLGNDPSWFGNSSTNSDAVLTYAGTGTNSWTAYIVDAFDLAAATQKQTALSVTAGYLKLMPYQFGEPTPNNVNYFPSGPPPYPFGMTYTGPTTVTGGTLEVNKLLGVSPVTVSGTGTLGGSNGIFLGPVTINSGGTLAPGPTITTLYISNNLTLGGKALFEINLTTGANDKVLGLGNLTYGGTLIITNVGAQAITNGTVLKLFDAATYTAGAVTVQPTLPAYGLRWDTSSLAIDGTLRVATVNTSAPTLTNSISGGSLQLTWPADHLGWRLQGQTNSLSVGLNTNWIEVAGSSATNQIQLPVAPGNPTVFFRLVYP